MNIVSIYTNFSCKGGAQQVTLQLAHHLTHATRPIVLTRTPMGQIDADYQKQAEFRRLSVRTLLNFCLKDTLFISHDRKSTSFLMLLKRTILPQIKVVHVAHSVYNSWRKLTLFPHTIVAVSETVKHNLIDYFNVNERDIRIIYNGIHDEGVKPNRFEGSQVVNILLAAQIYPFKRQVELAHYMKGKLPRHVHIYFAGNGVERDMLKAEIEGSENMHFLGHIDVRANIQKFHYTLLFSKREGLPITLIESCMYGLPMITNQLPAALEVNIPNVTGFAYTDFESLLKGLKQLPFPDTETYKRLSNNARLHYEKRFTEVQMMDNYESILSIIQ